MSKKTLIILRHGKAERATSSQKDHERALTERGVREAELVGHYLATHDLRPDKILCSPAARTRQTLQVFLPPLWGEVRRGGEDTPHPTLRVTLPHKGGGNIPVEYADTLYMASETQLLQRIAAEPDEVNTLMLVGHNPGLHQIALRLAVSGDFNVLRTLVLSFPTCALAVVELGEHWHDVADTRGELKRFIMPQEIR